MHSQTDWWSTFFSGLVLDTRMSYYPEEATRQETDFLVKAFGPARPFRVLDVPCGNGRLALELAARGFEVVGADLTAEFVEEARAKAGERRLEAVFETREMRDLPWDAEFDGSFCFGNSFGYLTDEGNVEFLKAVARALRPGGTFVLDAPLVTETLHNHLVPNSWHQIGEILMLRSGRYLPEEGRAETEYTLIQGDRTEKKVASYRVYPYRELTALLREAGFVRVEGVSSLTGEPFAWGSKGLYLIATR